MLAGAVVATVLGAGLAPAGAAGPSYVALGDSYSAGNGTRAYLDDGTTCHRSAYAYPSLVAAARGYALDLRACSGATTADVAAVQVPALGDATKFVTLGVGGNDVGFTGVLTECARPVWAGRCDAAVDHAQRLVQTVLPGRLGRLLATVRARAPRARVVVVGYPRIFDGRDCNALTWFSPAEQSRLNATADLLDARLAAAAGVAGAGFVDPRRAFAGHAVCDPHAWVNGLSRPTSDSYHPDRTGHASGYAPLVAAALSGAPLAVTGRVQAAAAASAGAQTARQRGHAKQDRTIAPDLFTLPDPALTLR